jgi:sulfur relay (sulfurtransferase) complex TusBCD TusD component (DsrE family)
MVDFIADQRARLKWKLRTRRGLTQEAAIRQNRALMQEMVRLQREIQVDVQMLASAAVARGVSASSHQVQGRKGTHGE